MTAAELSAIAAAAQQVEAVSAFDFTVKPAPIGFSPVAFLSGVAVAGL